MWASFRGKISISGFDVHTCTLPRYNAFDIKEMETGAGFEFGQRSNGRVCFLPVFKTLPFV